MGLDKETVCGVWGHSDYMKTDEWPSITRG